MSIMSTVKLKEGMVLGALVLQGEALLLNGRESLVVILRSNGEIMHATSELRFFWPQSRAASLIVLSAVKVKQFIQNIFGGYLARVEDAKDLFTLHVLVLPDLNIQKFLVVASPTRNLSVIFSSVSNFGEVLGAFSILGSQRLESF
jgi:hypothetical protein